MIDDERKDLEAIDKHRLKARDMLRQLMSETNMTTRAAADFVGVNYQTIHRLTSERGWVNINRATIRKVINAIEAYRSGESERSATTRILLGDKEYTITISEVLK